MLGGGGEEGLRETDETRLGVEDGGGGWWGSRVLVVAVGVRVNVVDVDSRLLRKRVTDGFAVEGTDRRRTGS